MNCNQPFRLLPTRVWRAYLGGRILDEIEGKPHPQDANFPEDWIGSATRAVNAGREEIEEGISTAEGSDGSRIRMDNLFQGYPDEVLGAAHLKAFGSNPQLLVKYLDSSVRLHMQAHPSVEWSQRNLNDNKGKTEVWWILGSREPDPRVYFGFQRPPSPGEWGRMMKEQDCEGMLACFDSIPVEPGDVLLINGGVPHAIGAGIFVLEVQEPTDYVVKTEYNVGGIQLLEEGATMKRGVDGILDLFDYTAYPADEIKQVFGPQPRSVSETNSGHEEVLLETPQTDRVEVRRLSVQGAFDLGVDGRCSILIVLDGEGTVRADDVGIPVAQWAKLFIPACIDNLVCNGNMRLARCLPPKAELFMNIQ